MELIGAGKIGEALRMRAEEAGQPVRVHRRGWRPGDLATGPLLVLTRNDDLESVAAALPSERLADLVLMQNGALYHWCRQRAPDATRGLLHLAVPARGDRGRPSGDTVLTGTHADAVARWLTAIGVPASTVPASQFRQIELEKLVWNTTFGLLCDVYAMSVGEVLEHHTASAEGLLMELAEVGARGLGLDRVPDGLLDKVRHETRRIYSYRASVKDWPWRNGWFIKLAREQGCALPNHERLAALRR